MQRSLRFRFCVVELKRRERKQDSKHRTRKCGGGEVRESERERLVITRPGVLAFVEHLSLLY